MILTEGSILIVTLVAWAYGIMATLLVMTGGIMLIIYNLFYEVLP